jgi:hypothetical protein
MIQKLNHVEIASITTVISEYIDFQRELPEHVFKLHDFIFYFIERPVLDNYNAMRSLIDTSTLQFHVPVIIKYLGNSIVEGSCLSFNGSDTINDLATFEHSSRTFFDGTLDYPIVLCSRGMEWFAVESACDELAVIAIKQGAFNGDFKAVIDENFISVEELKTIASRAGPDGALARAYLKSFDYSQGE